MKVYTKIQLLSLIAKGLVKDNNYWIINEGLYQWSTKNQNFKQTGIDYLKTIQYFYFDELLDNVYELENLKGNDKPNEL